MLVVACESGDPEGGASPSDEEVIQLDLAGREECQVAGYQVLAGFFETNGIEIWKEELNTEETSSCSVFAYWAEPASDEEEEYYNSWIRFGVEVTDSIAEAAETIETPERLQMSTTELHDPEDTISDVPAPWDAGFIWSQPDDERSGPTEVVARISNIVLYVEFRIYQVPDAERCEREGCVLSSDLVTWLHDEYLPAVGDDVTELIDG
jgi:hypothetical protein